MSFFAKRKCIEDCINSFLLMSFVIFITNIITNNSR
uniref:Uncharacterized protein n=1 Tax=Leuconostoc citreum TaxID=33964 RepID=A0A0A1ISS0_LEUCI|nr:Protein of unknown function [Leuconostoc citreum]